MEVQQNQSEVAQLLQQIEQEYFAGNQGLHGLAVVASHEAITARMERVGQLYERLRECVGDEAIALIYGKIEEH